MIKAVPAGGEWTPKHVLWGILTLIVLLFVEGLFVAPFDPHLKSVAATLVIQLLLALTLVGVAFGFATLPGAGLAPPAWLGLRPFRPSALKWMAAAVGAYIAFAFAYAVFAHPHQEDIARDLGYGRSGTFGAVAAGALIIAVAPFSEEVFFRGFVFGGLRRRLGLWPAAVVAGALFGAVHFTGVSSAGVLPQLAALGAILCWLYERTGSIWPTIALHVLNNALAFIFVAN